MTVKNPAIDNTKDTTIFWNGGGWSNNVPNPTTGALMAQDTGPPSAGDDVFLSGFLGTSPYPSSGSVTFSGEQGNLSGNNGPWSIVGNASFFSIGEYTTNVSFITPDGSNIVADGVYINANSNVDVTNTNDVTFDGANGTLGINDKTAKFTVEGFAVSDSIDFTKQSPTTALFSYNAEVDGAGVISNQGANPPYVVNYTDISSAASKLIKPISDGKGGVKLVQDAAGTLTDPDAGKINWNFIHSNESIGGIIDLSPYKAFSPKSGVTVGYGVDMGGGLVTLAAVAMIFGADWQNNSNLIWLSKTIGHREF